MKQSSAADFQTSHVASTNPVDAEDSVEEIDCSKSDERLIELVMKCAGVSRHHAIRAYTEHDKYIVKALMDLTISNW